MKRKTWKSNIGSKTNKEMDTQYNQLKQADTLMNSNLDTIPSDRMTARFEHWLDHYETIQEDKTKKGPNWYRLLPAWPTSWSDMEAMTISKLNQQRQELTKIRWNCRPPKTS
ncbi:MAG: hypothetical protein IPP42_04670 [Saprospiraceae bacterium]|nr:hypothetical protein [Saprospiraceae bacterium]